MELVKLESGKVYSGNHTFYIPAGKKFRIEATKPFKLTGITEEGEIVRVFDTSSNIIANKSTGIMSIEIPTTQFFTIDYQMDTRDPADPEPMEVGVPEPLSLRQRIQNEIRNMLKNEYGTESTEVETWEEAQDFLMDDSDGLISPYEALEMIPEEILPPEEVEGATAPETPTEPTPPPEGTTEPPTQ
jgi:hypothetical protein